MEENVECDMHIFNENGENMKNERLEVEESDMILFSDSNINNRVDEWVTYWDEYYERNYYYNTTTHESTWDPPPHLAFIYESKVDDADKNDNKEQNLEHNVTLYDELISDVAANTFDNVIDETRLATTLYDDDTCNEANQEKLDSVPNKRKKKVKKHRKSSLDNKEELQLVAKYSPTTSKYWSQRYVLFSKYDDGIRMDEEGWFSATPECIAEHHALRCGSGIIIDCFTGVGGNAIRFAPKSSHVIGIDIDPNKIKYAQHNAAIYGVQDFIEFITGDCFILAQNLKADTVFLSPPWGGPEYAKARNFDINTMLKPHDGQFLFNVAKRIAPRVVMFLPRNVDINQLAELSLSANPPWKLEVEKNFINGKLKAITAYFASPSV